MAKLQVYFPKFTPPPPEGLFPKEECWVLFATFEDLEDAIAAKKLFTKYWQAEYAEQAEFRVEGHDEER